MRSPKLLDRLVRAPRQLGGDVNATSLVACAAIRVQRDARGCGVTDYGDELSSTLKSLRLLNVQAL